MNVQGPQPDRESDRDGLVNVSCSLATGIGPRILPAQKTAFITAYRNSVQALVAPGWLTQAQATTLGQLAGAL